MKIIKETNSFDEMIFFINGSYICGNCRNEIQAGIRQCIICNQVLTTIIFPDPSTRLSTELFNSLYPIQKDMFSEESDYRGRILIVRTDCDVIASSDELKISEWNNYLCERIDKAGIPFEYRCKTIYDLDTSKIHGTVFTRNEIVSYFWGNNNTGKTTMACIILQTLISKSECGFFLTFDKIVSTKLVSWKDSEYSDYQIISDANIIVIDDAFDSRKSYIREGTPTIPIIDEFLRYRIQNGLYTIITSNLSLEMLEASNDFRQIARLIKRSVNVVEFK